MLIVFLMEEDRSEQRMFSRGRKAKTSKGQDEGFQARIYRSGKGPGPEATRPSHSASRLQDVGISIRLRKRFYILGKLMYVALESL